MSIKTSNLPLASHIDDLLGNSGGNTVRVALARLAALLSTILGPSHQTRAQLFADLAWPDGATGSVWGDSTPAHNGVYRKSGNSGGGSWSRIGDLPMSSTTESALSEARIGRIETLSSVAGTGAAYTASAPATYRDPEGAFFLFTPHADQTTINATLRINDGTPRNIRGNGQGLSDTPAGRLKAGVPVLMARIGAVYRIVSDWDGVNSANVSILTGMTGTASAYSATANAPLVNGGTVLSFTPPADNAGGPLTISINGGAAIPVYTENGQSPGRGLLKFGARYLAQYSDSGIRVYGVRNSDVDETNRVTHEAAAMNLPLSGLATGLRGGADERGPVYVQGGSSYAYWVASVADAEDHLIITGGSPRYVDLRMLRPSLREPLTIWVNGGTAKLIADRIYTASSGSLVRAWRPVAGHWAFDVVGGTLTEESDATQPAPSCDMTLINAGQSHAVLLFTGSGMHGIQRGLNDHAGWKPSIWPIQAASGATGLVPASDTGLGHWWNPTTNAPGPGALAWKAALDAKPANQPRPSAIIWGMGQNDASKMGADPTLSLSAYRTTHEALFKWMRDQIDPVIRTPIIWLPLQAYDNDVSPSNAQASAVRWTMFEIAAADPNVHVGPIYHDLWHPFYDNHPDKSGQMLLGYRLAATLARVLRGSAVQEGPRVTAITEENGGASYLLTLASSSSSNPIYWPVNPPGTQILDGIDVYASGVMPLSGSPVEISRIQWVNYSQMRIHLATPAPGAQIMWPAGALKAHRAGRYLRSTINVPVGTGWNNFPPLQPFRSGAL